MLKLPDLVLFEKYNGNWERYEDALYFYFKKDFIENRPKKFRGLRVGLKKYPKFKNKEATFWHLITEGRIENRRPPDFRRCERIRWPKPIIENDKDESIKFWENKRGSKENICLCFNWEYLVVLRKKSNYILPWTAYCPYGKHTKLKWQKEYNRYIKANIA